MRPRRADARGFTLLEMLAVVAIFALIAMMVIPGLGRVGAGDVDAEARRLSAGLELARQRAVATGVRHRLWLDLEARAWRVEWWVTEARALGQEEPAPTALDLSGGAPLDLRAPRTGEPEYYPVPNELGRETWLEGDVRVTGVETTEGWLGRGETAVVFETDGTAEPARIRLEDDGGTAVDVEVQALADAVRIVDAVL